MRRAMRTSRALAKAATGTAATQQAIFYSAITDTVTNPDSTEESPGTRWSFPIQDPPGVTTVDLTDLTTGPLQLAAADGNLSTTLNTAGVPRLFVRVEILP